MIFRADARRIPLAGNSVQCVVTSPPYWGLRKYEGEQELVWGGEWTCPHEWEGATRVVSGGSKTRWQHQESGNSDAYQEWADNKKAVELSPPCCGRCGAWRGAYGLEPTVEMYVEHTVEILREIRRVLRKDGVCFWNIGDSYNSAPGGTNLAVRLTDQAEEHKGAAVNLSGQMVTMALKPKDLCLIPFRVALAAQADGWWVRSDIIWAKNNPMPESATDRPTTAHEYVLMLTKSANYFWDQEAVSERLSSDPDSWGRHSKKDPGIANPRSRPMFGPGRKGRDGTEWGNRRTRNLRSVWTFPSQPYPDAHFATFPEELPQRCIAAATSERGACVECGSPWERIVERTDHVNQREPAHAPHNSPTKTDSTGWGPVTRATNRWRPGCKCGVEETRRCLVFDPFAGSGTVGEVAFKMGRRFVLADLAYQEQQRERIPPMAFLMG